MTMSPLHRRQFLISPPGAAAPAGWRRVPLQNSLELTCCPWLELERLPDGNGGEALLLGIAVNIDPDSPPGLRLGPWSTPEQLARQTYAWSGRWCLIAGGIVLTDPSGLLGLFLTSSACGQSVLVSPSLALLHGLRPDLPLHARRLGWYGANWFPPPGSRIKGVDKLLPDQALDLRSGNIHRAERWQPTRFRGVGEAALAALLLSSLSRFMRVMADRYDRLVLGLTAGLDSRTLLAAALAAGVEVDSVTHVVPQISRADRDLPPTIAAKAGVSHRLILPGRLDPERQRQFQHHCFDNVADGDNGLWPRGGYANLKPGEVLLRGGGFEIGRDRMEDRLRGLDWEQALTEPERLFTSYDSFGSTRLLGRQAARWLDWAARGSRAYSLGNHFYRDQRMAGWLSAVEQGVDLLDGRCVQVLNSAYQHDLMLAATPEARRSGALQRRIIALAALGLAAMPVNPALDSRHWRRVQRWALKLRRWRGELANLPFDRLSASLAPLMLLAP